MSRDPNELRVHTRDGTVWQWRDDPHIPLMRDSFERCAKGEIPHVTVTARNSTLKIYSDQICRVE